MHTDPTSRFQAVLVLLLLAGASAPGAWETGTCFRVEDVAGRPGLVAPDGRPFKSVGVVWAYGPERGGGDLTPARVIEHLELIKSLGFNTLNLYGDRFIPEILDWCDRNELAVYFRTCYYPVQGFPAGLREFPDYMDPEFRRMARDHYRDFLVQVKGHPSVLAIDMDHRWLFHLDWSGANRFDTPMIRPHGLRRFPAWLADRYGEVGRMNDARGTEYADFDAVIRDERLVQEGQFLSLTNHPLRADIVRYTLWTAEDFLRELAGALHEEVPFIITPTTEHPEAIPECSPPPESGIAFMSPVHYNGKEDFGRDPAGLCKLIYETRWHYDMQGGPAYVSETGWRTDPLEQEPPNRDYAWIVPPDEEVAARAYALQFSLLSVLPWVSGYGYFKLYDKWPEGDFGYLRDDGSHKPQAFIGDAINGAFDATTIADPEPQVWIYYPEYALASYKPVYQQMKTWVALWEQPFFDALDRRVDEHWKGLRAGDKDVGRQFAADVTADFQSLWRGFAFTRELPPDDKPIVLFSTISSLLSAEDREALKARRTVSFGEVGLFDDSMRYAAVPWYLEAVGLSPANVAERYLLADFAGGAARPLVRPPEGVALGQAAPWNLVPATEIRAPLVCTGQTVRVPEGRYTRIEWLASSEAGNAAPDCVLVYADGEREPSVLGPTISDVRYKPVMTPAYEREGGYLSGIAVVPQQERILAAIELPQAPRVKVHQLVLVTGGAVKGSRVSLLDGTDRREGTTSWRLLLPTDTTGTPLAGGLIVLQRSALGDPLVVARGTHAAFLYDPLTWAGRPEEVSRFVPLHGSMVDQALDHLGRARRRE
ncbi:MAG: hypothetical protein JXB04_05540 [Kiritimatiellae bacterium]|nr:hypothetical protein [Kiritimatiellia bacterium]